VKRKWAVGRRQYQKPFRLLTAFCRLPSGNIRRRSGI
jgi:hypothetical protein